VTLEDAGAIGLASKSSHRGPAGHLHLDGSGDMLASAGGLDGKVTVWLVCAMSMTQLFVLCPGGDVASSGEIRSLSWCGNECLAAGTTKGNLLLWKFERPSATNDGRSFCGEVNATTGEAETLPSVLAAHDGALTVRIPVSTDFGLVYYLIN
jgi:WD40 repeat protein